MSHQGTMQDALASELKGTTERLNSIVEELRFHDRGFAFSSVRPRSALETFGEHWKYVIGNHLDPESLFKESEKDGLKPIDVMLASIYSNQPHKIKRGKQITVCVSAGDNTYDGTHVVIWANEHEIIIPVVKLGDAQGIYKNTEKIDNLESKKMKFENRLQEIQDLISGKDEEPVSEPVLNESAFESAKEKKKDVSFTLIQVLLGVLAVAGIVYIFIPDKKLKVQVS